MLESQTRSFIEQSERKKVFALLQKKAEQDGHIPPTPSLLLRKTGRFLQFVGGAYLGFLVAVTAVLFNFLLFVLLLHVEF